MNILPARFVLSTSTLLSQYNLLKKLGAHISYSYKTNYEVGDILLQQTDCDISVHSSTAVKKIKDTQRIWFFAQGWQESDIKLLLQQGVHRFVVDNSADLDTLLRAITTGSDTIELLLRMRFRERTIHTGKHFVFGFFSSQIEELVPILAQNPLIKKIGLHVHRKTQNVSEWSLQQEFEQALSQQVLEKISYLNIGGGFPVYYKNSSQFNIETIFGKIVVLREWLKKHNVELYIEPGRFLAAPCICLETSIIAIYDSTLIVNCSVYNAAMDVFIASVRLLVKDEMETGKTYTIKGITPDSIDIFRYNVFLPKELQVGDVITFLYAGAYNFSSDFCLLPKLTTVIVP